MTAYQTIAGMATMPGREDTLGEVIASIAPQVDVLCLHVNDAGRWKPVSMPSNVRVSRSDANLGDQEKLLTFGRERSESPGAYLFTCDDDLLYPPDYVTTMRDVCAAWQGREGAAVSAHGSLLIPPLVSYYRSRRVYHCTQRVARTVPVDVLGTGCAVFHGWRFPITRSSFPSKNMADVHVAVALARARIARFVVPHRADWIRLARPEDRETIWHASRRGAGNELDTGAAQTATIREHAALFGL